MTLEKFSEELAALLSKMPADVPYEIAAVLDQAVTWLDEGPCEHCDGYHDSGSC